MLCVATPGCPCSPNMCAHMQLSVPIVAALVEWLVVDCHSGHSLLQVVERDRLPVGSATCMWGVPGSSAINESG